ncbi:MAG TPA: DUF885 family protein [Pyrinomonadaceae bacterium]|jgi:uncharacterized protein (DUF885 family)|nr:DUF885 family protein [Pyrinomonadaceae bacterium]
MTSRTLSTFLIAAMLVTAFPVLLHAQASPGASHSTNDLQPPPSELRGLIERYTTDRGSLFRSYPVSLSPTRQARFRQLYSEWLALLQKMDFDSLSPDDKVDYILFRNHLEHELRQLDIQSKQMAEIEPLVPFATAITSLEETRRRMEPMDSAKVAALLTDLRKQIDERRKQVEAGLKTLGSRASDEKGEEKIEPLKAKKTSANREVLVIGGLKTALKNWYTFYDGYDPVFTWWNEEPYKALDQSLTSYSAFLSEKVVGIKPAEGSGTAGNRSGAGSANGGGQNTPRPAGVTPRAGDTSDIVGDPIGREALLSELQFEMIPYTPEELIAIAEKDMAWCESEMKKASRELGYGDDWHKALEHVKTLYVEPGKQPELIRDLALEAIKFVDDRDLVTVPQLARDTWRMEMMTPERQLVSPFFLGGETILVSFPTNGMAHEQKMMSMRGNNIHFARATVFHELIPGHHLQGFMTTRYRPYRSLFSTPFWGEGWALYWELLMWDLKFAKSPENRIGMLFWRMHRGARIIFSLSFHLERMTPQECIDLLVKRVGHEPDNATAEVRRSLDGSYGPLYQAAYLLGGMQLYSLHHDLVDSGKLTNRQFHDWVLKENRIPIEMVRAILTKQKLTRDFKTSWRFSGQ